MLRKRKPRTSRMPPRKKRAKIGTPSVVGLVTRPASVFSLSDEAVAERVVEAADGAVAQELVLACRSSCDGELGRAVQVDAARREEPVVARVVGERGPEAGGEAVVEQVGERQAR